MAIYSGWVDALQEMLAGARVPSFDDSSNDDDFGDGSSLASGGGIASDGSWGSGSNIALTYEDNDVAEKRLKALYPFVDPMVTPFPRFWNPADKSKSLLVTHKALRVCYKGAKHGGGGGKDPACVRASAPVPPFCGIYYYEVHVVKGKKSCVGVGFCDKLVSHNRLPGWDKHSYGYHGDDGNFFTDSGNGVPYGPVFGTGDIIGCGLNLIDHTIFFTRNGRHLGIAAANVPSSNVYPAVGFQNFEEIIDVNFGQKPFRYDIAKDIELARDQVHNQVQEMPLPPEKTAWMSSAICSWLLCEGHAKALSALCRASKIQLDYSEESIENRNVVRNLLLARKATEATEKIEQLYPNLFDVDRKIEVLLKCQVFVEKCMPFTLEQKPSISMSSSNGSSFSASSGPSQRPSRGQKRRQRECGSAAGSARSVADAEEPPARRSPGNRPSVSHHSQPGSSRNGCSKNGTTKNGTTTTIEEEEVDDDVPEEEEGVSEMSRTGYTALERADCEKFREVLNYGRYVNSLASSCSLSGEEKSLVSEALGAIVVPDSASFSKLPHLQDEYVQRLARDVNGAIMQHQGQSPSSLLIRHFDAIRKARSDMIKDLIPSAPFLDINRHLFNSAPVRVTAIKEEPLEPEEDMHLE